jgi:hypothetical protein
MYLWHGHIRGAGIELLAAAVANSPGRRTCKILLNRESIRYSGRLFFVMDMSLATDTDIVLKTRMLMTHPGSMTFPIHRCYGRRGIRDASGRPRQSFHDAKKD